MAYRLFEIHTAVGDDSTLSNELFDRFATLEQTNDLIGAPATARIAPAAAEVTIGLGTLVQGYAIAIYSDYPVLIRLNGAGATQYQMTSSNPPVTNVGAPLPAACCFVATILVSSVRIAPIASAAQTANVWLVATGDPASVYT